MKRRKFINNSSQFALFSGLGYIPWERVKEEEDFVSLTILHTNDVHSRIDPFPMDGSRMEGLGGAARRADMVSLIRKEEQNVLLLDCGDIFQGTPYFNFFKGELEFTLMTKMNYDVATMGNHDFDLGLEGFNAQLPHANFPFVVSNYNFENTILDKKVDKYKIFEFEGIKIGILGLGIELDGLVHPDMYGDTIYNDPIIAAQYHADLLKNEYNCDYIICISHLGYNYQFGSSPDKVSDVVVAQNTKNIDLILGGHTHTFMRRPDRRRNLEGQEVIINQAGWGGVVLGRIDVAFEKSKKKNCIRCKNKLVN